mgnify:CR=1 FL=1
MTLDRRYVVTPVHKSMQLLDALVAAADVALASQVGIALEAPLDAATSENALLMVSMRASSTRSASTMRAVSFTPSPVCVAASSMRVVDSRAAAADRNASARTSSATTAKPRPASPARAASTAALSASKLVWNAISSIECTILAVAVLLSAMRVMAFASSAAVRTLALAALRLSATSATASSAVRAFSSLEAFTCCNRCAIASIEDSWRLAPSASTVDAACGGHLFFKCENLQKVGAFKARGATNAVFSLTDAEAAQIEKSLGKVALAMEPPAAGTKAEPA